MKHNMMIYSDIIENWIPNIGRHDLIFLCNRSSSLYTKKYKTDGCVDNYRVSIVGENDDVSERYKEAVDNGCCGSCDIIYTNKVTGNKFMIGFNYGH